MIGLMMMNALFRPLRMNEERMDATIIPAKKVVAATVERSGEGEEMNRVGIRREVILKLVDEL